MSQLLIELLMFLIPGVLAEQIFCRLTQKNSFHWTQLLQICCFSMFALALRCVVSIASGHGGLEIGAVFHGIGNFIKYCAVGGVMVVFTPPCIVILEKLFKRLIIEESEDGEKEKEIHEKRGEEQ